MNKFKLLVGALGVALSSFQLQAAPINVDNDVQYDSTTNEIILGDLVFASLDQFLGLTYEAANGTPGFRVATESEADQLINALLIDANGNGTNNCNSLFTAPGFLSCGTRADIWGSSVTLGENNGFSLGADDSFFFSSEINGIDNIGVVDLVRVGEDDLEIRQTVFSTPVTGLSTAGIPWLMVKQVPEPGVLALFGLGFAGLVASRRRRKTS